MVFVLYCEIPYEFKNHKDLKVAVDGWCRNMKDTKDTYGHISQWKTFEVKNMDNLFKAKTDFNEDISNLHSK